MTKVTTVPEGEIAYANYICSKLEAILRKHKVDFTCEYDYSSLQDVSYSWSNNRGVWSIDQGEFGVEIQSYVQANGDPNTTFEITHNHELVSRFFNDYIISDALDFVDLVMFKGE